MCALSKVPDPGDPSDVQQLFPSPNLQLLCCRYWWLKRWEFRELSYPYWRVYHNNKSGAAVSFKGEEYPLLPDKILMIAPNTSFSSRIGDFAVPEECFLLEGGRIGPDLDTNLPQVHILHLFFLFNIVVPYDHVSPVIFEFELTDHLQEKLTVIQDHLKVDNFMFDFYTVLAIQSLITDLLSLIPASKWDQMSSDARILQVLSYIESGLRCDLSNQALASLARLATNAFNRLFSEEVGISPQKYVKKKRVDRACALLHHSDYTIDQVAQETGFADRYHFSKVFKTLTGLSPARYRKEFGVK